MDSSNTNEAALGIESEATSSDRIQKQIDFLLKLWAEMVTVSREKVCYHWLNQKLSELGHLKDLFGVQNGH